MEQTTGIKVYEGSISPSSQVAPGYKEAWNNDTKRRGVVDSEGVFHITLPLNGWRERNLAEAVTGERDGNMWREVGKAMVVRVQELIDLPGFDTYYCEVLNDLATFTYVVTVEVVVVDHSYGTHILVTG